MTKKTRTLFTQIVDDFQKELKECGYFAEFFDRLAKDESTLKMCDKKGEWMFFLSCYETNYYCIITIQYINIIW